MRFSRRRLLSNDTSHHVAPVLAGAVSPSLAVKTKENPPVASYGSRSERMEALQQERAAKAEKTKKARSGNLTQPNVETADTGNTTGLGFNTSISDIAARTFLDPVMREFLPESVEQYVPPTLMYQLYRDIYSHDSISGPAVDMYASLSFSDFNLTGLDDKQLRPFRESIDKLRVRRLLPVLSREFQVHGMYGGQMTWDAKEKLYDKFIPHNPMYTYVKAHPVFGNDPIVEVDFQGILREMGGDNNSRRAVTAIEGLDPAMVRSNRFKVPRDELIYMTRGGMHFNLRGVSYLRRVLPIWLLEKALIRGTLDQVTKRQRAIPHIQVGEEDWTPTAEDMQMLAEMYNNAALDPVGAVFITRRGVDVNEFARGEDFWKWNDVYDWAAAAKMKALGINEAMLSGDASLNTLDMSLSVFIEQVREHRDTITYELFYERMFPRLAVAHGIKPKKSAVRNPSFETAAKAEESMAEFLQRLTGGPSAFETASAIKDYDPNKHGIPRVTWHKRLRPEADQSYLEVLTTLEEKGVPIPMQMWAASGGMDISSLINGMEEDGKIRDQIKTWRKEHKVGEEENEEEASVYTSFSPVPLSQRDFTYAREAYDIRNVTSDGKRKPLSAKGRKAAVDKLHKNIAEAAANVAKRENAKEKARTDNPDSTVTHYVMPKVDNNG